jgi:hypothetical protein
MVIKVNQKGNFMYDVNFYENQSLSIQPLGLLYNSQKKGEPKKRRFISHSKTEQWFAGLKNLFAIRPNRFFSVYRPLSTNNKYHEIRY